MRDQTQDVVSVMDSSFACMHACCRSITDRDMYSPIHNLIMYL